MQSNLIDVEVTNLLSPFLSMSTIELQNLLQNENSTLNERLETNINESIMVRSLKAQKQILIDNNKKIAQNNLSREPTFLEMKNYLINLNKENCDKRDSLKEKIKKYTEIHDQLSLDTTLALMQTSVAEIDEQSELIATQYLNGEKTFEEFIKEFVPKRKEAHLCRIKCEKFIEDIRRRS